MKTKKYTVSFILGMPEGTSAGDARLFVGEALMRMYKDMADTVQSDKDKEIYAAIQIPAMSAINVESTKK